MERSDPQIKWTGHFKSRTGRGAGLSTLGGCGLCGYALIALAPDDDDGILTYIGSYICEHFGATKERNSLIMRTKLCCTEGKKVLGALVKRKLRW